MNGPTSRMGSRVQTKYINLIIRVESNGIVIKSGGATFEIPIPFKKEVYVLPKDAKNAFGSWDPTTKKYVMVTSYGEVLLLDDDILPTQLNLTIKYSGEGARKFYDLLQYILKRYYNGKPLVKIPMHDKYAVKFAVFLARMSELQPLSDL